ncbi:cytochrome P450 [Xylariaceae sp. FL1272]|nr:cytochrome P450 [Xylariaceae sp. FL1272]
MFSSVLLVVGAIIAWRAYIYLSGFLANLEKAKSTGLKYYVVPTNPINPIAQGLSFIWIPAWQFIAPKKYWEDIIEVCEYNWQFRKQFAPFAKMGETFLIVTPTILMILTTNAGVMHEVQSRREAFPKPTEHYEILAQFGGNVLTTEGSVWRLHRKVTSASFNEKNAALVFRESIEQAQGMMEYWLQKQKNGGSIKTVEGDTMTLALNIISYVGFGLRLIWPGQSLPADANPQMVKYASHDAPEGHTLTFHESIERVLKHLLTILITPSAILNILPIERFRLAKEARDNYTQYMREFLSEKVEEIRKGDKEQGMDIMGSLCSTSYKDVQGKTKAGIQLDDSEIIGNAFIMFVAGHETTANTMHFTILELANNPAAQRQLQQDIDAILGRDSDPTTWDYEEKLGAMQASMLGAVMNETLRVMPPVTEIPKKATPNHTQELTVDGVRRTLPANTYFGLCVAAAHRNPNNWPIKPSKITDAPDDLGDWVPERWFRATASEEKKRTDFVEDTEDYGGYAGPDTSASMFRPVRGSYMPFSDGARSCLGRRIAIVEVLAALAVIFQKYSVENAVDDLATDAEVAAMTKDQKETIYKEATKRSRDHMARAEARITLKIYNGETVPLRLVKRGEERFVNWIDS